MENNREVLLKVEHLCQYFRLGRKDLKAVDDVSFEIRKGETVLYRITGRELQRGEVLSCLRTINRIS